MSHHGFLQLLAPHGKLLMNHHLSHQPLLHHGKLHMNHMNHITRVKPHLNGQTQIHTDQKKHHFLVFQPLQSLIHHKPNHKLQLSMMPQPDRLSLRSMKNQPQFNQLLNNQQLLHYHITLLIKSTINQPQFNQLLNHQLLLHYLTTQLPRSMKNPQLT